MFLFKASRYLAELKAFRPDIYAACEKALGKVNPDMDFVRVDKEAFIACPDDSIDYAVMEKTKDAVVVPMDAGWSDVGSWSSLWEISDNKDGDGNVLRGDVLSQNSHNNYVFAETSLVSLVGVDDLVVVQTKDATLVARRDQVQDVKKVVDELKRSGRKEHHIHREVYRPWGKYDSIDNGARYQVKRITVKPGEKLSQLEAEQSFVEGEPARGLRVLIRAEYCESAEIRQNGRLVQTVSFTNGETAAGPLAPGAYTLAAGDAECAFTLAENASLRAVSGDGWTDGEVLYFGPGG